MSVDRPDLTLAEYLDANVDGLHLGRSLFAGPPVPRDRLTVYVTLTGGDPPDACIGDATRILRHARADVRVQGDRREYSEGLDIALCVRDVCHYAALTDTIDVRVVGSAPNYIGMNDHDQPEWTMTVEFTQDVTTLGG